MDTNTNICTNDCIVETNSNTTTEKGILPFEVFNILNEKNLKNILSGDYKIKNKNSYLYLHDLESGNLDNLTNLSNTHSNETTGIYIKNFKPSIIFTWSVNIFRYFISIYNKHGSVCLVIYFFVMFWIIFIR